MINFSKRNAPALSAAMKLVASGKLGAPRHVHGYYLQSWLASDGWGNWTEERWLWRLTTAAGSGGVLADLGCHILDMATAVAGHVMAIRCELRTFPKILNGKPVIEVQGRKLNANDTAIIELDFADGAVGVIHTTRWATGYANREHIEVHGTEGALIVDLTHGDELQLCLGPDRHKTTWTTELHPPVPTLYHDFIESIHTGKQAQPDMFRGAEIQAYLDACERSAKSGRWEAVASAF
jgi:predicted dehydrogenase